MTPEDFRQAALALPGAEERAHHGHPDFRAGGKVFARLGWPDAGWAMVKLTPEQQALLCETEPDIFRPVPGGWGNRGSTNMRLAAADETTAKSALAMAWRNAAPKRVIEEDDN